MRDTMGLVKIGVTDSVSHRLCAIQHIVEASRRPVDLIGAVGLPMAMARAVEKAAHAHLAAFRVPFSSGAADEWFRVTAQRAACVVWAKAEAIWNTRKLKTWADTAPGLKALGITTREAWRKFGART